MEEEPLCLPELFTFLPAKLEPKDSELLATAVTQQKRKDLRAQEAGVHRGHF